MKILLLQKTSAVQSIKVINCHFSRKWFLNLKNPKYDTSDSNRFFEVIENRNEHENRKIPQIRHHFARKKYRNCTYGFLLWQEHRRIPLDPN